MSHYINAIMFLKIKNVYKDAIKKAVDNYNYYPFLADLYESIGVEEPYYSDWFNDINNDQIQYFDCDLESGIFKDDVLISKTSRARSYHFIESIKSSIDFITDGYIVITKDEDYRVNYFLKDIETFSDEHQKFYNEFKMKEEKDDGYDEEDSAGNFARAWVAYKNSL